LSLRGVIYHGGNHYVAWIFSKAGDIWFHDGISTGRNTVYEGNIHSSVFPAAALNRLGERKAVVAIYA
ncbi:hypothetical protein C8J57DRAFT_1047192, partial [Mycena rebaudengoi]